MRHFCLLLLCTALRLPAQTVEIHSEFQRIDPFGRIVDADRSDYPREILSPEVPRNAHSIFHIAVTVPENTSYFLYVGMNPPNLAQTTVYKEDFTRVGGHWIPDLLTPVRMPSFGFLPDATAMIPGQTTRCYLLDLWVPPNADVRRMRLEVLLKIGTWYVAPMEVRFGEARVPVRAPVVQRPFSLLDPALPDVADRSDAPAMQLLAGYLLGRPQEAIESWPGGPRNLREAIRRSAEQDMAIARQRQPVQQGLWFAAEEGILQHLMQNPFTWRWSGAEWYLRARDWIYRHVKK